MESWNCDWISHFPLRVITVQSFIWWPDSHGMQEKLFFSPNWFVVCDNSGRKWYQPRTRMDQIKRGTVKLNHSLSRFLIPIGKLSKWHQLLLLAWSSFLQYSTEWYNYRSDFFQIGYVGILYEWCEEVCVERFTGCVSGIAPVESSTLQAIREME